MYEPCKQINLQKQKKRNRRRKRKKKKKNCIAYLSKAHLAKMFSVTSAPLLKQWAIHAAICHRFLHNSTLAAGIRWVPQYVLMLPQGNKKTSALTSVPAVFPTLCHGHFAKPSSRPIFVHGTVLLQAFVKAYFCPWYSVVVLCWYTECDQSLVTMHPNHTTWWSGRRYVTEWLATISSCSLQVVWLGCMETRLWSHSV